MKLKLKKSRSALLIFLTAAIIKSLCVYAEPQYSFRCIDSADGLPDGYIRDIKSDKEGYIYFSSDKGVYRYDGNRIMGVPNSFMKSNPSLYSFNHPYSTSHERNKSTFVAADGNVWVYDSFGYGLESYDRRKKFFQNYIIKDIDEDMDGNLWIATNNNGIIVFNPKTEEYRELQHDSSISYSLPTNHTTCVFIDSISSTVWIGTSNNGVAVTSLLKPGLEIHKTGVANDVSSFSVRPDGTLLIGYDGGGLFDETGKKFDTPADVITNMLYNPVKRITYIATYGGGIYILKDNRIIPLPQCDSNSPAAFSRQMAIDSKGNLWIGTFSNGLIQLSGKGELRQYLPDKFPLGSNCIVGIDRHDDTLFVASTAGVCSVDLKTMTFKKHLLPDNINIRALRLDKNGRLWIATDKYVLTPTRHKLPIVNTRALTFDKDNHCWISSANGLNVVLNPTGLKNGYKYFFLPARLIGNSNGFNKYSIFTLPDGKILAGSFGSYLEISPSDILKTCSSTLKVSSISVNDRTIPFSDRIDLQGNDTLDIYLGSLNYLIPQSGRFGYRILPDTVIHPIKNAHLSLSEIPVGTSKLQLMELNSGDTKMIELKVKRHLSFYIYIILTILICVAICALLYWRYFRKPRRPVTEGLPPADKQFIERLEKVLENELGNTEFSIESFASEMGMSRSNLYKKVSQITGKSPLEYLREKRVEKGKQLLDDGHSHIGQVAYSVGLSPKQFSKFFKEKYGTLPSEYIKPVK